MDGFPKARTANIVVSEYKDEFLIYDLKTHKCHSLNSTAYAVWKNADGEKTINEISLEAGGCPSELLKGCCQHMICCGASWRLSIGTVVLAPISERCWFSREFP